MPDFSTRPRPRRMEPAETVLLLVAVFTLLLAVRATWAAWADMTSVRTELATARRETDTASARTRVLETGKGDEALATQALLTSEAPPPRILDDLAQLLPADARLDGLTLVYGDRLELELRLSARSPGSYDIFLTRLERSPLFANVAPGEETRDPGTHGIIRATYRGAGP
jgi:Tfp pilus assembly protein PilN